MNIDQPPASSLPQRLAEVESVVTRALGWAIGGVMGLAVVNVLWQVFTRYVLGRPSAYTDELARFLLIWVSLLGAAYASGQGRHLAIDLFAERLAGRARAGAEVLVGLLVSAFAGLVMVFGGLRLVWLQLSLEQTSAALQVPLGYVYLALPVSGVLVMFYAALPIAARVSALIQRGSHADAKTTSERAGRNVASSTSDGPGPVRRDGDG